MRRHCVPPNTLIKIQRKEVLVLSNKCCKHLFLSCSTSLFLEGSASASTPDFLATVFGFFDLLSRSFDLCFEAGTDLAIPRLKHFQVLKIFIDQTEASGSPPAELSSETKRDDGGGISHGELLGDVCLRSVGSVCTSVKMI